MPVSPFGRAARRNRRSKTVSQKRRFHSLACEPLESRRLLTLLGLTAEYPRIIYDQTGTTAYTAATDAFDVSATPFQFFENAVDPFINITSPAASVELHILVDNSGNLIGGTAGDDLVISGTIDLDGDSIADYSGVLLTGEILEFGYQNTNLVPDRDFFDFRFKVTGGQLAAPRVLSGGGSAPNFYDGKDIYITQLVEAKAGIPSFQDSFEVNFGGNAKGTEGPVDALIPVIEIRKSAEHDEDCIADVDGTGEVPLFNPDPITGETTVTYNYEVENFGNVGLVNLVLLDDGGPDHIPFAPDPVLSGGFNVGDYNQNGILDYIPDGVFGKEIWQYTFTVTLPAGVTGYYTNEVTVTADAVIDGLEQATDIDEETIFIAVADVTIEKRVNGQDANVEPPPFDHVLQGSQVDFTYFVTNTGNVILDIDNPVLFEDDGGFGLPFTPVPVLVGGFNIGDANQDGLFNPGESWEFEKLNQVLNTLGLNTNTVNIELLASDINGDPIDEECVASAEDSDIANIIVDLPSVTLVKEVVDPECIANIDGQGDVPLYEPGDVVPYQYTIDNTGTTPLIVNLTDVTDNGTPVNTGDDITRVLIIDGVAQAGVIISGDDGDNLLETSEIWVVTFSTTLTALGYNTNQGFLIATPADGEGDPLPGFSNLEETDNAVVFIGVTGIQIEKRVNSQDANTEPPPFPQILAGSTVNYSYLVTNTGNVILDFTSLLDDAGGVGVPFTPSAVLKPNGRNIGDANNNFKFDPGESWEYEKLSVQINAPNTAPDLFINEIVVQATPVEFDLTPIDEDCLPSVEASDIATVRVVFPPSSLAGYVWEDCDDDGVFDADEFGLGGVTIQLFVLQNAVYVPYAANPDEITSNVPGMLGYYEFTDLPPGTYQIFEVQPAGFFDGQDTIGPPNNTPGGVVITNDQYSNIVLPADTHYASFNFGEIEPSSIEGCVYIDTNNNNVKDPGELALQGVTIYLTGIDYRGNVVDRETVTDSDGMFIFTNLPPALKEADGGEGYTLTEGDEADALFIDGKDHAGTAGGVADGPPPDCDIITGIFLEGCFDATDYCFGEFGLKVPSKRPFIFTDCEWQNRTSPFDVTQDGCVTNEDLLAVLDSLNRSGTKSLSGTNNSGICPDVDGDKYLGIKDALALIDVLNRGAATTTATASTTTTTSSATSTPTTSGGLLAFVASSDGVSSESSTTSVPTSSSAVTTSTSTSNSSQSATTLTSEDLLQLAYGLAASNSESSVDVNELYDAVYAAID